MDIVKLFLDKRLSATEPEHLTIIKGQLAELKAQGDGRYQNYSDFYGVDLDVKVIKEPEAPAKQPQHSGKGEPKKDVKVKKEPKVKKVVKRKKTI
jgi:hypothetical protein